MMKPPTHASTAPTVPIMKNMAPFAAGATVESDAPMQTEQAFAADGASTQAMDTAVMVNVLMAVFKVRVFWFF